MLHGPARFPMLRQHLFLSTFALSCAASPLLAQTWDDGPTPRQVAAPASDIESGLLRLPEPAAGAVDRTNWKSSVGHAAVWMSIGTWNHQPSGSIWVAWARSASSRTPK